MRATCVLVFLLINLSILSAQDYSLSFLTFNIRYDNPEDGENAWPNRKEEVANTIEFFEADIVGAQEALEHQIQVLKKLLPENYEWVGVGRTDGKTEGEYSPIFFNNEKVELLDWGTFWLSETPEKIGSVGWDAALPRIVTWAKFNNKFSKETFLVFNTHFDHRGEKAREESARLIIGKIELVANNLPVVLLGDFNVLPDSSPYQVLAAKLRDVRKIPDLKWYGANGTFNGFANPPQIWHRIDYIFINDKVKVLKAGTLSTSWNGKYVSDHFPVFAKVRFQ